jgi:hypothetical protein
MREGGHYVCYAMRQHVEGQFVALDDGVLAEVAESSSWSDDRKLVETEDASVSRYGGVGASHWLSRAKGVGYKLGPVVGDDPLDRRAYGYPCPWLIIGRPGEPGLIVRNHFGVEQTVLTRAEIDAVAAEPDGRPRFHVVSHDGIAAYARLEAAIKSAGRGGVVSVARKLAPVDPVVIYGRLLDMIREEARQGDFDGINATCEEYGEQTCIDHLPEYNELLGRLADLIAVNWGDGSQLEHVGAVYIVQEADL